jgi:hypothetical protein
MAEDSAHLDKYRAEYEKHLGEVDEVALHVLKGHLIIESVLDNLLAQIFFYPKYIRLGFAQKAQIARAYALRKNEFPMWNLLTAINEMRNAVAHSLSGERRARKMEQLRRLYFAEMGEEFAAARQGYPDHVVVVMACTLCTGFVGTLEDDTKGLRRHIDTLDAVLNPGQDRVRPPG